MSSTPLILLALLAATLPTTLADATLQLPFFGYDGTSFDASVVTAAPSATVLALACPTDNPECGLFPFQTLTIGPSTYKMDMAFDDDSFTMTQDCKSESVGYVCAESASGSSANFPGSSTTTYEGTDFAVVEVVVTKGEDQLGATAAPSASASVTQSESKSAQSGSMTTSASPTPTPGASGSAGASPSASGANASPSPSPSGNAAAAVGVAQGGLLAGLGLLGGLLL